MEFVNYLLLFAHCYTTQEKTHTVVTKDNTKKIRMLIGYAFINGLST